MRAKSLLAAVLLAVLAVGCGKTGGSPVVNDRGGGGVAPTVETVDEPGPATTGEPEPTAKRPNPPPAPPKVPGVPIDVDPNFNNGNTWADAEDGIVAFFTDRCGGVPCVEIKTEPKTSTPGDCEILGHTPADVRTNGTITFFLDSPCGGGETTEPTEESTPETTVETS